MASMAINGVLSINVLVWYIETLIGTATGSPPGAMLFKMQCSVTYK